MSIQSPWIVVQTKERVPIKHLIIFLDFLPLLIKSGSLFFKIDFVIQSVIVKLGIWDSFSQWFSQICLVEDVHDLNDYLHHLLVKDLLHDNNTNVALELLNCRNHHFFRYNGFDHQMTYIFFLFTNSNFFFAEIVIGNSE